MLCNMWSSTYAAGRFSRAPKGDLYMSLIHTCELNGVNPFDYLTELGRHAGELKQNPSAWLPWTYRQTLAQRTAPAAAA